MIRSTLFLLVLSSLVACKSYQDEWMQSQRQLGLAESRVSTLQSEVEVRDQAIEERDRAIAERDRIIREQCVAKPQPEM